MYDAAFIAELIEKMPEDEGNEAKADTVLSRKLKKVAQPSFSSIVPCVQPIHLSIFKVLDSRLENDKDTVDALKELSSFFTENNMKTRRNL